MSKSNTLENGILALLFNATALADLAQNDGSSPATDLYIALYTSDPGEAGAANTNETAYTNYARVAVSRDSGGFTVSGNAVTNAAEIAFPACGVTGATITHFGVVVGSSGAGVLLYKGALTASLAVSAGITPRFAAGELDITED
jgi:hypothetical protein